MGLVLDRLGNWLGRALSRPVHVHGPQDGRGEQGQHGDDQATVTDNYTYWFGHDLNLGHVQVLRKRLP